MERTETSEQESFSSNNRCLKSVTVSIHSIWMHLRVVEKFANFNTRWNARIYAIKSKYTHPSRRRLEIRTKEKQKRTNFFLFCLEWDFTWSCTFHVSRESEEKWCTPIKLTALDSRSSRESRRGIEIYREIVQTLIKLIHRRVNYRARPRKLRHQQWCWIEHVFV